MEKAMPAITEEAIGTIFKTTDYNKFSFIDSNREIEEMKVLKFMDSFKKNGFLLNPIIVNEKFQIIEGQHRFTAARRLGIALIYQIASGYSFDQIVTLNTNGKNWVKKDFIRAYCIQGSENYLKMQQFMKDFPELGSRAAESLLTLNTGGAANKNKITDKITGKRSKMKNLEEGRLEIPNITLSYQYARKIMQFKEFFPLGFNKFIFVSTMISIFKNEEYDHDRMLKKLALNPGKLKVCRTIKDYKDNFEEIYNHWNRNGQKKINFRIS